MDVPEMHLEFDITLDKVASEAYPEFLSKEKDFFLTEFQSRFIKQRYGGNNNYRTSFEESQKRTDDLKNLVVTRFCELENVEYYEMSNMFVSRAKLDSLYEDEDLSIASGDEYFLYIKGMAQTCNDSKSCCMFHGVKQVQQDDLTKIIKDPFNKPKGHRPVIFFEDGDIFVTAGLVVPESFMVTFIRTPKAISLGYNGEPEQQCELSEHTHKEIVQGAVEIALENIESRRIETQLMNVNQSE
jgi:hypothetical protein